MLTWVATRQFMVELCAVGFRVFGHVECYKAEGVEFRLLCGRLS